MTGGDKGVQETPQQVALAQHAKDVYSDWKQRWLPLQKQLARNIEASGELNSPQQRLAEGKSSTDTAMAFSKASESLEKQITNSGAGIASPKGKLAIAGLGDDEAASEASGLTISDQQIKDAYLQGLSSLTQIGQGQSGQVSDALGIQASQSARQAASDAEISAADRAGTAGLIGQGVGFGLQRMGSMKGSPGLPEMPQYNYSNDQSGLQYSAAGADVSGRR